MSPMSHRTCISDLNDTCINQREVQIQLIDMSGDITAK